MNEGLAVCSYTAFREEMGVAVRTSTGYPRFWRGTRLEYAKLCAPFGIFGKVTDPDEYARLYRAHLDAHAGEVAAELAVIARRRKARLVLCCFEDLSKPGKWCHRTTLAAWLEERTGLEVPELGPPPAPPGRVVATLSPARTVDVPVQGTLL